MATRSIDEIYFLRVQIKFYLFISSPNVSALFFPVSSAVSFIHTLFYITPFYLVSHQCNDLRRPAYQHLPGATPTYGLRPACRPLPGAIPMY